MAAAHERGQYGMDVRVQKQLATYWRVRIGKTIARLESEARRMLALEEELASFAGAYYEAVGPAATRLAELEDKTLSIGSTQAAELEEVIAHQEGKAARGQEIKSRYRSIAMEIHPDKAAHQPDPAAAAETMQHVNDAYKRRDLAALLGLEAQLQLIKLCDIDFSATHAIESALYEVERAADTYASGYRSLLNSPLNELMLRAMSAKNEGWDFITAVQRNMEKSIAEKEQALGTASNPAAA